MDSHVREVDSMVTQEEQTMKPIVLFGIQFTLRLVAYWLIAFWYVAPRLSALPPELALARYPNQPHSDLSHVDVPSDV